VGRSPPVRSSGDEDNSQFSAWPIYSSKIEWPTSWLVAWGFRVVEAQPSTGLRAEAEGHHNPGWASCWSALQHIPSRAEKHGR